MAWKLRVACDSVVVTCSSQMTQLSLTAISIENSDEILFIFHFSVNIKIMGFVVRSEITIFSYIHGQS